MLIVAIIALAISMVSLFWTIRYNNKQARLQPMLSYLSQIVSVEKQVGDNVELLRCHGIEPKELDELGVTAKEFGYLLTSFTLGHAWYLAYGYKKIDKEPFPETSYRYKMITSEPGLRAWPVLKQLISSTEYREKLEATIQYFKREKATLEKQHFDQQMA